MASQPKRPEPARRSSWLSKAKRPGSSAGGPGRDAVSPVVEGQAMEYLPSPRSAAMALPGAIASPVDDGSAISETSTPALSRRNSNALTREEHEQQANQLILTALNRVGRKSPRGSFSSPVQTPLSAPPTTITAQGSKTSLSKMSFSSMMGGLSLSLTRSNDDRERGRTALKDRVKDRAKSSSKDAKRRSSSLAANNDDSSESVGALGRSRSTSPFLFRRARREQRDASPDNIEALTHSDVESDAESIRPRGVAYGAEDESDDETEAEDDEPAGGDDDEDDGLDEFDPLTESNTERNALVPPSTADGPDVPDPDPLGEGVNVVIPPEPYFPTTLNQTPGRLRRRKTKREHDPLQINTARPVFQRDRCTIAIRHGEPERAAEEKDGRVRRYVVASDLSEESRYAVEWGIGTVLRDGDEMLIVNVSEDESKVDPGLPNASDRTKKVRSQQERQAIAYILVRQATSLLQRTQLNVSIKCQAWHAKNARHMLLDIVDYLDPTMLIVGSRGLGQLKGILLGSTSHYLIQKCSVPVMVARRRLKRPPKRAAHLAPHRPRVSLAKANIDTVASRVDQDVAHMREEVGRDEERRREPPVQEVPEEEGEEEEGEEEETARKVPGE